MDAACLVEVGDGVGGAWRQGGNVFCALEGVDFSWVLCWFSGALRMSWWVMVISGWVVGLRPMSINRTVPLQCSRCSFV